MIFFINFVKFKLVLNLYFCKFFIFIYILCDDIIVITIRFKQ